MNRIVLMVLRNFWKVPAAWFKLCHYAKNTEKYDEETNVNGKVSDEKKLVAKTANLNFNLKHVEAQKGKVDYDKIKGNLILRSRLDGDRFIPYGMNGSKKLKQFLCELKIPSHKRDEVPILCDDEGIVAVIPYRISEKYKISESTTKALKLQMLKEN